MVTLDTVQKPTQSPHRLRLWILASVGAIALLVLAAGGFMYWRMHAIPADLNLATTRVSAQGLYRATIRPAREPIPVNTIHSWILHVETADGRPVETAQITLDGDMPQHGHGMATTPQVSEYRGGGDYLVEGMKFQMGGWWVVEFDINANGNSDRVSFNLILK
jgi:hypothetical protein